MRLSTAPTPRNKRLHNFNLITNLPIHKLQRISKLPDRTAPINLAFNWRAYPRRNQNDRPQTTCFYNTIGKDIIDITGIEGRGLMRVNECQGRGYSQDLRTDAFKPRAKMCAMSICVLISDKPLGWLGALATHIQL